MIPTQSPGEMINRTFFLEDIEGEQYLVNRATGHIGIVNESAGIVIRLFLAGLTESEVVEAMVQRVCAPLTEIRADVRELIESLELQSGGTRPTQVPTEAVSVSHKGTVRHYRLNGVTFSIEFPSQQLFAQVNALFATMAIAASPETFNDIRIVIRKRSKGYDLLVDDKCFAHATLKQDIHGYLRGIIIRKCYAEVRQLSMFHAACVSYKGRAVILAAPSGGGKSTLALALAQQGWGYHGDDTIGVDLLQNRVLPFPTMVSIKRNSWPIFESSFPDLTTAEAYESGEKAMKVLNPPPESIAEHGELSIAGIAFIQFDPGGKLACNALSVAEALARLGESGTVFHPQDVAASPLQLLRWLRETPCVFMRHMDVKSARNLLLEAFWKDKNLRPAV